MSKIGTIVDVRTHNEFNGGHVVGSVNIPLQEITAYIEEIRSMEQPVVFCCASGNRSGQATLYFQSIGVECKNGGSWMDVNNSINN